MALSGPRRSSSDVLKQEGLRIACDRLVRKVNELTYLVKAEHAEGWYEVYWDGLSWRCQCEFNSSLRANCKHIYAVVFTRVLNPMGDDERACPKCRSHNIIKKGARNNKSSVAQRYRCKDCGLYFTDRPAFYRMKADARCIVAAVDLYFKGLSLSKVQDHLEQFYGMRVTRTTIYNWVSKYVKLLKQYVSKLKPKLGEVWLIDETKINVKGRHLNLWNALDKTTKFLIANQLTLRRRCKEAERLLMRSLKLALNPPARIITDGLTSYQTAAQKLKERWKQLEHIANVGLKDGLNNAMERLHNTVKERVKVMRSLDNRGSARLFADGLRIYYNFIRPHMSLGGKTPADAAIPGFSLEENRWLSLIRRARATQGCKRAVG